MKFRIFPRRTLRGRRWVWHLKAGNGEIIAQGESYHNHADALAIVRKMQAEAASSTIETEGPLS